MPTERSDFSVGSPFATGVPDLGRGFWLDEWGVEIFGCGVSVYLNPQSR